MRRADRLFQIIQLLRKDRATTARSLADSLEVSERTIYRDIQDLSLSGVPIIAESGVGYRLMSGYYLPPLMFTEEELSALLIGARMVRAWTDPALAKAASHALQKIENVVPDALKPEFERKDILVPDFSTKNENTVRLQALRVAVKEQQKAHFSYTRADGENSERTVHPLGLFYWGSVWTMVAWCQLRDNFRQFRIDRMINLTILDEHYHAQPGQTLDDYINSLEECDSTQQR